MEMETIGWFELFSDKLVGLDDRLEIGDERGRGVKPYSSYLVCCIWQ